MADKTLETTCCVVGGGPAGVMLGYLLARAGVEVTVLEKHQDFNRDFRGDTVHPSTLEVMYELGLLHDFLKVPHQKLTSVSGVFGDFAFKAADFSRLPTHCKFVALMPQWDFLDFLSSQAKRFPSFHLQMQHECVDLIHEEGRIRGVQAQTPEGPAQIRADLVIGCDGRHATTRRAAGLEVIEYGVPIDVLWFRISRQTNDPEQLLGNINYGRVLILINRGDYFQAGLLIRKGSFEEVRAHGLEAFRQIIRRIAPYLGDRVDELQNWEQIRLLTVQVNRLRQWYRPGLLCIGDAAHAMSPVGGVGINLAIQDAVATANLLADPLREGRITEWWLAQVQQRREFPTRVTQRMQVFAHSALQTGICKSRSGESAVATEGSGKHTWNSACAGTSRLAWEFGRSTSRARDSRRAAALRTSRSELGWRWESRRWPWACCENSGAARVGVECLRRLHLQNQDSLAMTKHASMAYLTAIVLGLIIVCVDLFADRGEISPAVVLALLLGAGAIVGAIHKRFSVLLAVLTAVSLPGIHLALHLAGRKTTLQPDTVTSILMVGVVAVCAATIGVLIGAAARRTAARM